MKHGIGPLYLWKHKTSNLVFKRIFNGLNCKIIHTSWTNFWFTEFIIQIYRISLIAHSSCNAVDKQHTQLPPACNSRDWHVSVFRLLGLTGAARLNGRQGHCRHGLVDQHLLVLHSLSFNNEILNYKCAWTNVYIFIMKKHISRLKSVSCEDVVIDSQWWHS